MEKAINAIGSKRVRDKNLVAALEGPDAIEALRQQWETDPESVSETLKTAFAAVYES